MPFDVARAAVLQSGPVFLVPFGFAAGFGLLLALAGAAVHLRYRGRAGGAFERVVHRGTALALVCFGGGMVAIALDYAGTLAGLLDGVSRPDGTPMEPSLLGRVGLAAPWQTVALALFVAGALLICGAVAAAVGDELDGR